MNAPLAIVERRPDGRLYPPGGYHPPEVVEQANGIIHALRCGRGESYRRIQARLAERGIRFSLGLVYHYARAYCCDRCEQP